MKAIAYGLGATLGLTLAVTSSAHHSVSAQFDTEQVLVISGVLRKVELVNPHSYMSFTVTENGQSREMNFETAAPIALKQAGLSVRYNLKLGDTFKLVYNPARNGNKNLGLLGAMTLPDGRFIGFGSKKTIDAARALSK
jgi:hypothetical protein